MLGKKFYKNAIVRLIKDAKKNLINWFRKVHSIRLNITNRKKTYNFLCESRH